MVRNKAEMWSAVRGGLVAGIIAGIFNDLMMIVAGLVAHEDFWGRMKGAAMPFLHERAMQPGFDAPAVVAGVLCNFLVSSIWAIGFGLLAYGLARAVTVVAGAVWGIVVWLGMVFVLLPILGLGEMARHMPVGQAIMSHVAFGLVVALAFLPFQVRQSRRESPPLGGRTVLR